MYGVDEYITQYENEIGPPWKAQDLWIKISYPFFHAGPDQDADAVPRRRQGLQRAARSEGSRCTRRSRASASTRSSSIYPSQFHGITVPSYKVDRLPALRRVVRQVPEGDADDDRGRTLDR
jgi:hypothetical protein